MNSQDKASASMLREANIFLLEEEAVPQKSDNSLYCQLGTDIVILYDELRNLCLRHLEARDLDLLVVAAAVAFADRNVTRYGRCWSRIMNVTIPVHEKERWTNQVVSSALSNTLGYLTGDIWNFSFVRRKKTDPNVGQLFLERLIQGDFVLVPYSGGLDSFAASRLLKIQPFRKPFYITIETSSQSRSIAKKTISKAEQLHASLPVRFKKNDHPEASSRTRTFLFFAVTALAARMLRATNILVSENGQGALGPSLVPSGTEHPYVGTHPAFTKRFAQFITTLWDDQTLQFEHPYIWHTKAELLSALKEKGLSQGWDSTVSCPCDLKRHKGSSVPLHCGMCSNCLLRRMSAFNAGLSPLHGGHPYLWNNLSVDKLADAVEGLPIRNGTTKNDRDIALGGVLSHTQLAQFADELDGSATFLQAVYELSRAVQLDEKSTSDRLKRLLVQHRQEWRTFLAALPAHSWVRQYAGDT